jgi:protein-S-isoprenylcysteine O-methyltransferase Ste14
VNLLQEHLLLAAAWVLWCALHSLLIGERWMGWVRRRSRAWVASYRLAYVLFSTISLAAVLLLQWRTSSPVLWHWPAWLVPLQWGGLLLSAIIFVAAARRYDQPYFFGIRQLRDHRAGRAPEETGFVAEGVLRWMRHPYYTAGMLFLAFWGDITPANLILKIVGIGYFIIGAMLEERKLITQFGASYLRYRATVPMFFPNPFRTPRGGS